MPERKPLILVVDDEVHILHVVSLKLRNAGFDVITAEDGEEALELALRERPDLVMTDYQMPFMTGLDLCRALRADPTTANTPALMLTARGFSMPAHFLEQTNISGVITKPFSPREILSRVTDLIGHAHPLEAEQSQ